MNYLKIILQGLELLPEVIHSVENLSGKQAGEDKKSAVLEIVKAAIHVTDAVEQKNIIDAEGFSAGLGLVVDGIVACMNASLWHEA